MAANAPQLVEALLMDAFLDGVTVISKKKLLWMLGWTNDKPKAWSGLLAHWERMGHEPGDLQGMEVGNRIVLFFADKASLPDIESVSNWAD